MTAYPGTTTKVTVAFGRLQRETTWKKTAMHCPRCAAAAVWFEDTHPTSGYVGTQHLCTACDATFTIQGPFSADQKGDQQRLAQLRAVVQT